MKNLDKYLNIFLSLGFTILAPLWFLLFIKYEHIYNGIEYFYKSPPKIVEILESLNIFPIIILLAGGIYFSWKNFKSKESYLTGNIILLIDILMALYLFFGILWLSGMSG
ncbi:MAG TPA: hypothetical protein VJI33_03835 [Candidatus Paceibacterota bacterium]